MRRELREARTHRGIRFSIWWDHHPGANAKDGYWRWGWRCRKSGRSAAGVCEHKTLAVRNARATIDGVNGNDNAGGGE